MKKDCSNHYYLLKKIVLLCLLTALQVSLGAQTNGKKIKVSMQDKSLEAFVKTLEKMTNCTFVYGEDVKLSHPINLKMKDATLSEIMSKAFADQPISFEINGRYIILKKKHTERIREKPRQSSKRKFTIHGYITDGHSSETLIGANVFSTTDRQGTATNPYGYYSITLPEGEADILISYIGYVTEKRSLVLRRDTLMNIQMDNNNILPEIVVTSNKSEAGIAATQMGAIDIPIGQIKSTPALLGEKDVLKTIQLMPGVQSGTEGSAGLYVRGGDADQNLILLDGIPIYKVDHLFGFFSIFTPEAMKKVTFFKGSFPARFGGRLSSVIDVRTNDGDMHKLHGSFSVGTLTSKIMLEGPIKKDKTSFLLTVRRTYLDLPSKLLMDKDSQFDYYFYDVNAKINHRFSDNDRLFLSFYGGKDHMSGKYKGTYTYDSKTETETYTSHTNWGNNIFWLRWNHIFNNKLFCNTTVAYNHYSSSLKNNDNTHTIEKTANYSSHYQSLIKDWSFQNDFEFNPSPTHQIKFGTMYTYHAFHPEVLNSHLVEKGNAIERDTTFANLSNSAIFAHEASIYAEDNWQIGRRLKINFGVYPSLFHVHTTTYFSMQPRVSARYQLNSLLAFKAAYTQMKQYIHLLTSLPIALPTDLWVPITQKIKPMSADQYSAGAYFTGIKNWELSVEGYYKKMNNVLEYKDGVSFYGNSSRWEDKVEMGTGRSYGIELLLQKTEGRNTGWLSYTWSKSDRQFSKGGINDGKRFPYTYDRRHHLVVVFNRHFNKKFDLHASWEFYTGGMATLALKQTALIDGEEAGYVPHRNNYRLPSSHTLCLGCDFNKQSRRGLHTWSFSIYNMYGSMNPTFVLRDTDDSYTDGTGNQPAPKLRKFTLLPFVPSFTYSFKF